MLFLDLWIFSHINFELKTFELKKKKILTFSDKKEPTILITFENLRKKGAHFTFPSKIICRKRLPDVIYPYCKIQRTTLICGGLYKIH